MDDPVIRKTVGLRATMWDRVAAYQLRQIAKRERGRSLMRDAEAIRQLLDKGLAWDEAHDREIQRR